MVQLDAVGSIDFLARCVLANQIDLVEAAIRISGLSGSLDDTEKAFLAPFSVLARAANHLATHERQAALDPAALRAQARERRALASVHEAGLRSAASAWLAYRKGH